MRTTLTPRTSSCGSFEISAAYCVGTAQAESDADLVERCNSGDPDAWDSLVRRYEVKVHRFAYSLCRDHDEAGDIAGQVFLRLYQYLHSFRREASFSAWLFRIIRNTYLDMCIRAPHRQFLSLDTGWMGGENQLAWRDLVDPAPTPEAICMANETARLLEKAIDHLTSYHIEVLRMYHSEGKSYGEIAEALGVSLGTVKSRMSRARRMLRRRRDTYDDTHLCV